MSDYTLDQYNRDSRLMSFFVLLSVALFALMVASLFIAVVMSRYDAAVIGLIAFLGGLYSLDRSLDLFGQLNQWEAP